MNNGYSAVQNKANGGYSFTNNGTPISALSYAQGTGQDFNSLLNSMANSGDTGAQYYLKYSSNPSAISSADTGGALGGASQLNNVFNALTWGANPNDVLGAATTLTPPATNPYQSSIDIAQNALNSIPTQLQSALGNIQNQYGQQKQSLDTDSANALNQYNQSKTQNQQSYRTGQNQVNQQASQDRQSLLRTLAGLGAGGGSEAMYLIPQLVGNVDSRGLGAAAQTFGQNAQNLATNYGNFQNQQKTAYTNLSNWLNQQNNSAKTTADTNKQSLLDQIASLQSDVYDAQPYINQINAVQGDINNLAKFNPQYAGSLPNYIAPSLSSFTPAAPQAINVAQQASSANPTPYLSLLLGQDQNKKQLV